MRITATGRLTKSEPEIQNIPGTPAHALEMFYARYGAPKHAHEQWETSGETCPRCEREHVEYCVFDGPGPLSRYLYRCNDCANVWWAED